MPPEHFPNQLDLFSADAAEAPHRSDEPLANEKTCADRTTNRADKPRNASREKAPKQGFPARASTSKGGHDGKSPSRLFLRDVEVAKRYSVSRPTIWRWVKKRLGFPSPVQIAEGTTRWAIADLEEFERSLKSTSALDGARAGGGT